MNIRDIILEEVDMSWLRKLDQMLNPEAAQLASKEETLCKKRCTETDGTPVQTKSSEKQQPHTTRPRKGETRSPGYRGLVNVHLKSGHISKDYAKKLVSS